MVHLVLQLPPVSTELVLQAREIYKKLSVDCSGRSVFTFLEEVSSLRPSQTFLLKLEPTSKHCKTLLIFL